MGRRHAPRLPPGRYPRDRWRALATAPLVAAIIVVGVVIVALMVFAMLAVMGGVPASVVLERFEQLRRQAQQPLLAAVVGVLGWGITQILRRVSQWGGIERGVGTNQELLREIASRQDADRAEVRRLDAEQARQIAVLGEQFDAALEDLVEGFRVAMATVSTPAVRQRPDEETEGGRRHRDATDVVPAVQNDPPPGGPLIAQATARARANLDPGRVPSWDELVRDPRRSTSPPTTP